MPGSDGSRDQLGKALRLSCNHRIHSAAALVLRHGLSVRAATHPCARIPALRLCVRRSRLARTVQNLGAAGTWVRASRGQQAVVGCACFRNAKAAFDVPTMSTGTVPKVSWRNPPNPSNAARNTFACSSLIGIRLPRFVDSAENPLKTTPGKAIGDPAWIRTRDLQLRRLLLYPLSYGAVVAPECRRAVPV